MSKPQTPNPKPALKIPRTHNGATLHIHLRHPKKPTHSIRADFSLDGHRHHLSTGTNDLPTAIQFAQTLDLTQFLRIIPAQAPEPTLPGAGHPDPRIRDIARFYTGTWMPNRNRKPRAIYNAAAVLDEFDAFCVSINIGRASQLSPAAIEAYNAWLRARGNIAKTIAQKLAILRAAINAAADAELLTKSPIKKWIMPQTTEKEIQPLEPHELQTLLQIIHARAPQIYPIIAYIAYTGNRPSDARDLKWSQVNLTTNTITRPQIKTSHLAEYQISPPCATLLQQQKQISPGPGGEVFVNPSGLPITRNYILRIFKEALRGTELDRPGVNLKQLRHTFGYIMVNYCKCPLPIVQRLMGHTDIQTTMKYVRSADAQEYLTQFTQFLEIHGKKPLKKHPRPCKTVQRPKNSNKNNP